MATTLAIYMWLAPPLTPKPKVEVSIFCPLRVASHPTPSTLGWGGGGYGYLFDAVRFRIILAR
eukprot:4447602-Pyramimonas_sp.AAC.1